MPMIDPLAAFLEDRIAHRHTIPLVSTALEVEIAAGLAAVTTTRVFRNEEERGIEAVMVFPVPVHAALFDLEVRVDGRVLRGVARRQEAARDGYEAALDEGRLSVLHEEVLCGVHMLSVAPIPPGGTIEVAASWAQAASIMGRRGQLRVPLTVGQVYGRSPLLDSDALTTGGPGGEADLLVRCHDGPPRLRGGALEGGRARVSLGSPIDLELPPWEVRALDGRTPDGRDVRLTVEPATGGDERLDVAVLVDRSGSMDGRVSRDSRRTKHDAVAAALASAVSWGSGDRLDLWEFANDVDHLGGTGRGDDVPMAEQVRGLVGRLSPPDGGTEIGGALRHVAASTASRDVLLLTDGLSHALDVHALARLRRRVSVVLIGENSLEARVGHLAALTGGDMLIAQGAEIEGALAAALDGLRTPSDPCPPARRFEAGRVSALRGGAMLRAEWGAGPTEMAPGHLARAAAALAAHLQMPELDEVEAARWAEAQGLVTHLTSLLMVDEEGEVHPGPPATRKVDLAAPVVDEEPGDLAIFRKAGLGGDGIQFLMDISKVVPEVRREPAHRRSARWLNSLDDDDAPNPEGRKDGRPEPVELDPVSARADGWLRFVAEADPFDWVLEAERLTAGRFVRLPPRLQLAIIQMEDCDEVAAAAERFGLAPEVLAFGLLARHFAARSRDAARVARSLLGGIDGEELAQLEVGIGLGGTPTDRVAGRAG